VAGRKIEHKLTDYQQDEKQKSGRYAEDRLLPERVAFRQLGGDDECYEEESDGTGIVHSDTDAEDTTLSRRSFHFGLYFNIVLLAGLGTG